MSNLHWISLQLPGAVRRVMWICLAPVKQCGCTSPFEGYGLDFLYLRCILVNQNFQLKL